MINNRQGGRRRGRGGQRPQGMAGNSGGARDNRQRGNAAQLLEKYKNMARDAQLAGDRVQTEYYLQFADHYFRVLGESRARFEEQRRPRGEDGLDDEDEFDAAEAEAEGEGGEQQAYEPREPRQPRGENSRRSQSNGRARPSVNEEGERIAFEALPPSIGAEGSADEESAERRPRRRKLRAAVADEAEDGASPAA